MLYTNEQINELLQNLSEDVKEAISSTNTAQIIFELQKKYNLHIDQMGELSNEILLLTIGVTPPQKFIDNLETRMKIPRETTAQIATEVNEKIFRPIRESLMQIHNMKDTEEGIATEKIEEVPKNTNTVISENPMHSDKTVPKDKPSETPPAFQKTSTPDPYREIF